jgi:hypothetical protein
MQIIDDVPTQDRRRYKREYRKSWVARWPHKQTKSRGWRRHVRRCKAV